MEPNKYVKTVDYKQSNNMYWNQANQKEKDREK